MRNLVNSFLFTRGGGWGVQTHQGERNMKKDKEMDVTNDMDKKEKTKRRNYRKKFMKEKEEG
jgi:hypothetical protein